MLPDWPETKQKIGEAFLRRIRSEAEARLGFLGALPCVVVHEGDGTGISRADGSRTEAGFAEIGATLSISTDEFAGMQIPAILEKLGGVAEDLARGRAAHALAVINDTCQEAGNVVDAGGGPMTPDLILAMWDKVELAFDDQGRPIMPTIMVHPDQQAAVEMALARLFEDPEFKDRAFDIVRRQREDWLAREADRTLAG